MSTCPPRQWFVVWHTPYGPKVKSFESVQAFDGYVAGLRRNGCAVSFASPTVCNAQVN